MKIKHSWCQNKAALKAFSQIFHTNAYVNNYVYIYTYYIHNLPARVFFDATLSTCGRFLCQSEIPNYQLHLAVTRGTPETKSPGFSWQASLRETNPIPSMGLILFTYIWLILMVNVGKYTSPMDGMGMVNRPWSQGLLSGAYVRGVGWLGIRMIPNWWHTGDFFEHIPNYSPHLKAAIMTQVEVRVYYRYIDMCIYKYIYIRLVC